MRHQFARVEFTRFKAFRSFKLDLKRFNILVGPNNSGKSTILAAFRILAAAIRRASARTATPVRGPSGMVQGYAIDLASISVAEENIFYNYQDDEPAYVVFTLSNSNTLTLYFPAKNSCLLIPDAHGKRFSEPSSFRKHFNCQIGFVPILGPVDHNEIRYEKEAARLALSSYTAARNFRNIWHHYPDRFEEFRSALQQTWPGMDIEPPELDLSHEKPRLYMFCPEDRIPRELFWSGFGFQVWCQMLTHLIQSRDVSIFLIDEPDIYLHSELQRQLLALLRDLGPDILLATHSTEMIAEAEVNDIVLIHKSKAKARRMKDPSQLTGVFNVLGSNINPILTQLAKTRRVLFVEGKDFQILGRFARRIGEFAVGNRRDFAVVPIEGFNPDKIRVLKTGMEAALGVRISSVAILDRDYCSEVECLSVVERCKEFCDWIKIHDRKEIENFVLVPAAINRAATQRMSERMRRAGEKRAPDPLEVTSVLDNYCEAEKSYVITQFIERSTQFDRDHPSGDHKSTVMQRTLESIELGWKDPVKRVNFVSGKDALTCLNRYLQEAVNVSVTALSIIDSMRREDVPEEMVDLIKSIKAFSTSAT